MRTYFLLLLCVTKNLSPKLSWRIALRPLHYAVKNGHLDVIKVLLKAGASPSSRRKVCAVTTSCIFVHQGGTESSAVRLPCGPLASDVGPYGSILNFSALSIASILLDGYGCHVPRLKSMDRHLIRHGCSLGPSVDMDAACRGLKLVQPRNDSICSAGYGSLSIRLQQVSVGKLFRPLAFRANVLQPCPFIYRALTDEEPQVEHIRFKLILISHIFFAFRFSCEYLLLRLMTSQPLTWRRSVETPMLFASCLRHGPIQKPWMMGDNRGSVSLP